MTELAKLKAEKNFTVKKISELCGYRPRMINYFLSGEHVTPHGVIPAVQLEPKENTDKITRYEFINLLVELDLTPREAATILVRHADRVEKMANIAGNPDARIPIRTDEVEMLRNRMKKGE